MMVTRAWAFVACSMVVFALFFGCASDDDDSGDDDAADDDATDDDTGDDDADDDADDDSDDDADDDSDDDTGEVPLPVEPTVLVGGAFTRTEGIAFLPDGSLFVVGNQSVYRVGAGGDTDLVADLTDPIGMAHDGAGSLLVADFGPTSGFDGGTLVNDGFVASVTPEGDVTTMATGIPDPNFITVRADGSLLVSDDYGHTIFDVSPDGTTVTPFFEDIDAPNGMVYSLAGDQLFVCQTFTHAGGIIPDTRIWTIALDGDGSPTGAELLTQLPALSAPDGSAMDELGRLYVAANVAGVIWRIDPVTAEAVKVADGMPFVASLAFGRGGDFPETSLYATQLVGGKVWELELGVKGAAIP